MAAPDDIKKYKNKKSYIEYKYSKTATTGSKSYGRTNAGKDGACCGNSNNRRYLQNIVQVLFFRCFFWRGIWLKNVAIDKNFPLHENKIMLF
ncbi:MAG: hypothetical protein RR387_03025 [Clostridiales bacterium]